MITIQKYIDTPSYTEKLNEILSDLLHSNTVNDEVLTAVEDVCMTIANQKKNTKQQKQ